MKPQLDDDKASAQLRHQYSKGTRHLRFVCALFAGATLVLMVWSCNDAPKDENTDDTESVTNGRLGRLSVADGKLIDDNGAQVVLHGLGLGEVSSAKGLKRWNAQYFADARSWNASIVRLPVNPTTYSSAPEETLTDLDDAVEWCKQHQMYLIIDYHIIGNVKDGLFDGEWTATTWSEAEAFWADVAARYGEEPVVAFAEIYNEPSEMAHMGGNWDFSEWQARANKLIAIVREAAPEMIPLVGGMDWAYDFSPGGEAPFDDPNIALSVHPYAGKARQNPETDWDAAFGYLADKYPIIFTELGFDPHDTIYPPSYMADLDYGRRILNYAAQKNISWTAFVFYSEPGVWPMSLFSDWDTLDPTVPGLFFKDVLAGTAIDIAGDGFDRSTDVVPPVADGPSETYFPNLWNNEGASAEWVGSAGTDGASAHLESEGIAQAGMSFNFTWDVQPIDTSIWNELMFTGDVTKGAAFSVSMGRNEGHIEQTFVGCSWNLEGKGAGTYVMDLLSPDWCGPDACFDMQSAMVSFGLSYSTAASSVDIEINSATLQTNSEKPLANDGIIGHGSCK